MIIHILPIDDLIKHEETSTCECCPSLIIENNELLLIHNALDNRK